MLRKFLTTCIVLGTFYFGFAQTNSIAQIKSDSATTTIVEESKPKTIISGSVDVYYKYDFNKQASNNKTSFTNSHNSFELGAARIKIEHTVNKIDMVAELAFGK